MEISSIDCWGKSGTAMFTFLCRDLGINKLLCTLKGMIPKDIWMRYGWDTRLTTAEYEIFAT